MQKNDNKAEELLLDIPQAAKLLHIAPHTLRVWLSKNIVLPQYLVVKLGGRTLLLKQKLISWIEQGCKPEIEIQETMKGGDDTNG